MYHKKSLSELVRRIFTLNKRRKTIYYGNINILPHLTTVNIDVQLRKETLYSYILEYRNKVIIRNYGGKTPQFING